GFSTAKDRMFLAELNQHLRELEQLLFFSITLPIQPADLIVLALRIVISVLRSAEFVTTRKHRHTLRQEECCQEISTLPLAQLIDLGIIRRTLRAAVPS